LNINTHGDNYLLLFSDEEGRLDYVDVGSERMKDFFKRLGDADVIRPGSRVYFSACWLAKDEGSKKILQDLSNEFEIQIIANQGKTSGLDFMNDLVSFTPEDNSSSG